MSEPLKFVLIDPKNQAFSMFFDGSMYMTSEPEFMKTFVSEVEALLFQKQIWNEAGYQLTVGFLDYYQGQPFVESCEFLYRGDI